MKHTKKNSILFLLTFMIVVFTTGCGLDFDASGYVQACLDANAHGEFAAYAEITNTPVETIEEQFNAKMDEGISYLDTYHIDESKKAQFRELLINIYNNFEYEVGEAVKNDDGSYSVPVTTYKLMVYKDFIAKVENFITDYAQQEIDAGRTPIDSDIQNAAIDFMYDYISKNLEALEYAEGVTTTITVAPSSSNSRLYSINEQEFQTMWEDMVDTENSQ